MWDLVAFMETVARNGLDYVAIPAGENLYRYAGDSLYVRTRGSVHMACAITAAIGNVDEFRFHRGLDPNWCHSRIHIRDQTGVVAPQNYGFEHYPFNDGDTLTAQVDNANVAQYDCVLLAVSDGKDPGLRLDPHNLPVGAKWVAGLGAATAVAATWTNAPIVWTDTFNITKTYQILGMYCFGATAYAARLIFKGSSPSKGYGPGVPAGDTLLCVPCFYADFGTFMGDQPPDIQYLASAGDTVQNVGILVIEK